MEPDHSSMVQMVIVVVADHDKVQARENTLVQMRSWHQAPTKIVKIMAQSQRTKHLLHSLGDRFLTHLVWSCDVRMSLHTE